MFIVADNCVIFLTETAAPSRQRCRGSAPRIRSPETSDPANRRCLRLRDGAEGPEGQECEAQLIVDNIVDAITGCCCVARKSILSKLRDAIRENIQAYRLEESCSITTIPGPIQLDSPRRKLNSSGGNFFNICFTAQT
ncbi:hypothetical protein AVEN_142380-1 [Araneus ventricosus]|uniref:Uncharacterized protein n=1 Tax=Araneus ventricosus TaxID=182803 RepID=A0A4Y2MKM2_ARAVE|nr:hypothetical protein AVEN_142380-1 [Araneus ventricosus]